MQYHNAHPPRSRAAFTLVELLVVIAIIGILIALLLPAVQAAREAARRLQCANHFKQIGIAMHTYHNAVRRFPYGSVQWDEGNCTATQHGRTGQYSGWAWSTYILPYLDQGAVYDQFDFSKNAYWHEPHHLANREFIDTYLCPSDPHERVLVDSGSYLRLHAVTNVSGVSDSWDHFCNGWSAHRTDGDGVLFNQSEIAIRDISDGTSHTLMVGEVVGRGPAGGNWQQWWSMGNIMGTRNGINLYVPAHLDWSLDTLGFASFHTGGCNFLCCDGSTHFISEDIDSHVLRSLTTRAGISNNPDPTLQSDVGAIPPDVLN